MTRRIATDLRPISSSRRQVLLPAVAACIVAIGAAITTHAAQDNPKPAPAANPSGVHDFDFLVGDWRVHHRRLKTRLADSHEWIEFDGTQSTRPLMDGSGNVSENLFDMPGGAYRGVSVRAYDPAARLWAIWWLDGRNPFGALDPPLKGRFESAGTFYADDTLNGKPIRVRYSWSGITPTAARWEQAFSADGGQTWETNWISDFRRTS